MDGFLSLESLDSPVAHSASARLKHLCPEDKARIGELVRRLAVEKKERTKVERELATLKRALATSENERLRLSSELSQTRQLLNETQGVLSSYRFSSPQATHRVSVTSSSEKKNCSVQTAADKEVQTERTERETASPKMKRPLDGLEDLPKESSSNTQSAKRTRFQSEGRAVQMQELPRDHISPEVSRQRSTKQNLFLTSLIDPLILESVSKLQRSSFQQDDLSSPRYNPLITPRTVESATLHTPDSKAAYYSDSLYRLVDELEAQPTGRWPEGS